MQVRWAPCYAAVAVLGLALVAGQVGRTVVDVSDLPLRDVPAKLGPWTCTAEEMPAEKNTGEAAYMTRTYVREDGTTIEASMQVTASRLGALRNWSIAMMGNGWNVEPPIEMGPVQVEGIEMGPVQVEGVPYGVIAKLQWLHRPGAKMLTSTWFASPTAQAVDYERAQALGWRDKLLGDCIWGELYLKTIEGASEEQLREATEDLTIRLAPHFYGILTGDMTQ